MSSDGSSARFCQVGTVEAAGILPGVGKGCMGAPLAGLIREPVGDNARSGSDPAGDIVRCACGTPCCCCCCCCNDGPCNDKNKDEVCLQDKDKPVVSRYCLAGLWNFPVVD